MNNKLFLPFLIFALLVGCDQALNKAGTVYLKLSLEEACGETDTECIAAVKSQFDSCHKKYKADWDNYMNSSISKEDELLEVYSIGIYGCIVDENGEPYFIYDPE